MNKLKEGDIVELVDGHRIKAGIPNHLHNLSCLERGGSFEPSHIGDFSLSEEEIEIGGHFHYFAGNYIVTRIEHIPASGDNYAGGSAYDRVYCEHTDNKYIGRIELLSKVEPSGRAIKKWEVVV